MNKAYLLAREHLGLKEVSGPEHNEKIVAFFHDVGHDWVKDDETAWCAAFLGAMLHRAGLPHTGKLNARSYMNYGVEVDLKDAQPGDIVVFWRGSKNGWQGHVGFFVKETAQKIRVLGGNQTNMVNEADYGKDRLLGIRRIHGGRDNIAKSKTMQAVTAAGAATVASAGAAMQEPNQIVPIVMIGAFIVIAALVVIGWERIKKWKEGIR